MADSLLPTKEELEQLYHKRGKDALVWYAWRNALRALPLLGNASLIEVWGVEEATKHVYSVCRVNLLLSARTLFLSEVTCAYDELAMVVGRARHKSIPNEVSYSATYAVTGCALVTYAPGALAFTAKMVAIGSKIAIRADFDYLRKNRIREKNWLVIPLWPKKRWFRGGGKPKQFAEWERQLLGQLRELGLDFLAEDVQKLWEGQAIDPKRLENYAKDLTEEITNDPVALRKAITGEAEVDKIQAVRCLLLGPGGAGKSSLADRLQGRELEKTEKDGTTYVKVKSVTTGVDYLEHQPLKLEEHFEAYNLGEQPLDLYLWDFGGQTIFHGLHSAFLHENCVYVLVVDSRHEQAPDEWLHQIQHLSDRKAKVLLVTNEYEKCKTKQNERRLLREFGDILSPDGFFYFSCHEPNADEFKGFVEALVQRAFSSQKSMFSEVLAAQASLQQDYQNSVFRYRRDLKSLFANKLEHTDFDTALDYLRSLGFLVEVKEGDQCYCLKPSWAVDNAYRLLHAEKLRGLDGIADMQLIDEIFAERNEVSPDQVKYLVEFLQERQVCCQLKDRRYFFPDAASADEPESIKELVNQEESLTVRFDLPYLPLGFHAGMVSRLFQTNQPVAIRQPEDIWRQGFILHGDGDRAKAVVSYQVRKSTIGLVLVGEDLLEAANILVTFQEALHEVLGVGKSGIEEAHLQPFVVWDQRSSSLLSGDSLVVLLENINSYQELIEKIKQLEKEVEQAMAPKKGDTNIHVGGDYLEQKAVKNEGGANSNFATNSKKFSQHTAQNNIEVTADQREQIALMAGALLENFKDLKPDELTAVAVVNQALEEPEEAQSQQLLGTVVNGLDKTVGFVNNAVGVGEFVTKHWGAITTAFTAAAAVVS